jgi:hypothetical protein
MSAIRIRVSRRVSAVAAAAAALMLGLSALSVPAAQPASVPQDARTLVRQALAAVEVSPPNVGVAAERVLKALFAKDTRGVDMPRLRDAQQALSQEDTAAAAGYLIEALHPEDAAAPPVDRTLLAPVRPRFAATPLAYALLAAAALLIVAGGLVARG